MSNQGFIRYPHLERFGNVEVEGIEHGTTYVFPKLDGTNASVWMEDGKLYAGSRNRILSLENDNHGFYKDVLDNEYTYQKFFEDHPELRLYGEWLVPHTLRGYKDDAWRKFYVFDVFNTISQEFLKYDEYQNLLLPYHIHYIPCFAVVKNGDSASFTKVARECRYLLKDEQEFGEGCVIKNYSWQNRYGRKPWAKIILSEFKTEFVAAFGPNEIGGYSNEERLLDDVLTKALVDKEFDKISNDLGGWSSKAIPRLLETVFYCVVTEELWTGLKKHSFPTINFKALRSFTIDRIKKLKPEIF